MRGLAILWVLSGCDLALGLDKLAPTPPDATAHCVPGRPFHPGELIDMGPTYSVEALRMNAQQSQAFLALATVPMTGPPDYMTTDLYFAPVEAGAIGSHNQLAGINSPAYDSYPTPTQDGQHLIYGSKRTGSQKLNVATAVDNGFDMATLAVLDLGGGMLANEPYALGTSDVLYYEVGNTTGDLYRAEGGPTSFANATLVGGVNTADRENAPVVSDDELEIFFASDRAMPGRANLSGLDIYTATRASPTAPFDPPVLLPALSSADVDYPVWLTPDGCALYYIKKEIRTIGLLYVARR